MCQLKIDPGMEVNSLTYTFEKWAFLLEQQSCFTIFFKGLGSQKNQVNFYLNHLESVQY